MRRTSWLALAGLVGPGRAGGRAGDIFAAVQVAPPAPRTDFDIAVVNATTGARVALPAGTNTSANETHPTITVDGRRLAFQRSDPAAGTVRIITVDVTTSQSADLFNGFEVAQRAPSDPAIMPTSSIVYTGGPFVAQSGAFAAPIVSTALLDFPQGPFTRSALQIQYTFATNGSLQDMAIGGAFIAFQEYARGLQRASSSCGSSGGSASQPLGQQQGERSRSPGWRRTNPKHRGLRRSASVFRRPHHRRHRLPPDDDGRASSGSRPRCRRSSNSTVDEVSAAPLTGDGRYLAFVRDGSDRRRLFAWDSETQTLLNATGVDLGAMTSRRRRPRSRSTRSSSWSTPGISSGAA